MNGPAMYAAAWKFIAWGSNVRSGSELQSIGGGADRQKVTVAQKCMERPSNVWSGPEMYVNLSTLPGRPAEGPTR